MGSNVQPKWKLMVTRQRPDGTIFRRGVFATDDAALEKAKKWLRAAVRKEYGQQDEVSDLTVFTINQEELDAMRPS